MGWFIAPKAENIFFHLTTPKKKFAYILVNGLMANFEFRSFLVKKVHFFHHGALILPRSVSIFGYFQLLT